MVLRKHMNLEYWGIFDEDYNKNLLRSIEQDIIDEYQPNLNMISAMKR